MEESVQNIQGGEKGLLAPFILKTKGLKEKTFSTNVAGPYNNF